MTVVYTCQGHDVVHFAPLLVLKWTHTILSKWDFLTEWQATEDACELAMLFDHYSSVHGGDSINVPRKRLDVGSRVTFSDDVEIAMGLDDMHQFQSITVPNDVFWHWATKPWALRTCYNETPIESLVPLPCDPLSCLAVLIRDGGHTQLRTTDAFFDIPSRQFGTGNGDEPADHDDPDDAHFFLHEAPEAIKHLFDNFLHQGFLQGPRLTESIFLRAWYIHHTRAPLWHHPRIIELHGHWRHWYNDVIAGWQDVLDAQEAVDFYLCHPDPPRSGMAHEIAFAMILAQGLDDSRTSGLVSVLKAGDLAAQVQYSVAASLPLVVSGHQLADVASIRHTCRLNGCRIRHDLAVIPFSAYPVHDMTNGDTFTIAPSVPAASAAAGTADDQDIEMNQFCGDDGMDEHDDRDNDDDPPDDSSSSASNPDPQAVHIHRLGRGATFGHVEWRTYFSIFRDAVQHVGGRRQEYTAHHYVRAHLEGLSDTEEAIILQHINDIAPGSREKLVILDAVLHAGAFGGRLPPAPAVTRATHKTLPQLARSHVLQLARVDHYCAWVRDQCIVQIDNVIWPPSDVSLRNIAQRHILARSTSSTATAALGYSFGCSSCTRCWSLEGLS